MPKEPYIANVKPLGYPDTAAVCGLEQCENPGLLWLKKPEFKAWEKGRTVFEPHTNTVRIRIGPHEP